MSAIFFNCCNSDEMDLDASSIESSEDWENSVDSSDLDVQYQNDDDRAVNEVFIIINIFYINNIESLNTLLSGKPEIIWTKRLAFTLLIFSYFK